MNIYKHLTKQESKLAKVLMYITSKYPVLDKQERLEVYGENRKCKKCFSTMVRRESNFRQGQYWYGCRRYPRCIYKESN